MDEKLNPEITLEGGTTGNPDPRALLRMIRELEERASQLEWDTCTCRCHIKIEMGFAGYGSPTRPCFHCEGGYNPRPSKNIPPTIDK